MDKHRIRTRGLNKLIGFLKSSLEGQEETEYKVKMKDRMGSVNLRKVNSYPSARFLEYLTEELQDIDEEQEFENLLKDAVKYTVIHLSFSEEEDLVDGFLEKVDENYVSEEFEIDTDFTLEEFAEIELNLRGIENYDHLKIIPVLGEENIGEFDYDNSFKTPVLPLQVTCRYRGKEISKVFESADKKQFDFTRGVEGSVEDVEKALEETEEEESGEEEPKSESEEGSKESQKVYVCDRCGDEFLSKSKLQEHLEAKKAVEERKGDEDSETEEASEDHQKSRKIFNLRNLALVLFLLIAGFFGYSVMDTPTENNPVENLTGNKTDVEKVPSIEPLNESQLERSISQNVNELRQDKNLAEISYSSKLSSIADKHARSIAERRNVTHYSSEGLNYTERFERSGYVCSNFEISGKYSGAENIIRTRYGYFEENEDFVNSSAELSEKIAAQLMEEKEENYALHSEINFQGIGAEVIETGESSRRVYVVQDLC